jgi:hypothetical protein
MGPGEDFQSFVAARSGALFRGALVLTGSREAAEDLVQETLERTCRRWRTIAAMDAPDAYVRRIMVNLANDRWKRFRRVVPQQDTGDDRPAPGDEYGRIDSRDQLVRALQRLPIGMRTVVVLRYFHASRMPKSPRTCGSHRAPYGPSSPAASKNSGPRYPHSPNFLHRGPGKEPKSDDRLRIATLGRPRS